MLDTLLQTATVDVYYRLKMICNITGDSAYSNAEYLNVKFPYQCYCESFANGGPSDLTDLGAFSIGNFIINTGGPHLSNPTAVNALTVRDNLVTLYLDSIYQVAAYHIIKNATHQDAKVTLFIDFNNNFIYDIPDERVWTGFTSSSNVFINGTIVIPATAVKDVFTGMRLIINNDVNPNIPSDNACGQYTSGETEDYIVKIRDRNDPTNVPEVNKITDISLYPNPTTGAVNVKIKMPAIEKNIIIKVYTITGQQIYQNYYQPADREFTTLIDLNDNAKGIYFVEIRVGKETVNRKLIVK